MFPTLQLGPLSLQVPGLVMLAGLWVGLTLAERRVKKHNENPGHIYNLVFIALIAGFIGARLSYAITYQAAFSSNLGNLLSLNPGLLDPFAGVLIGGAAALIYIYRKQLPIWSTLDSLTPLFAVLAIALGIANLAAGNAFGSPTAFPWGIYMWGAIRHPTQIYETILAVIILVVILIIDKYPYRKIPGLTFLVFTTLSAGSRMFVEAFRGDSILLGSGFRSAQIISWIVMAVCLALIGRRIQISNQEEQSY